MDFPPRFLSSKFAIVAIFTLLGLETSLIEPAVAQRMPSNIPSFSSTLSVAEAYAAIPHDRTEYQFPKSRMEREERKYFSVMFPLIDRAVVLRIESVQKLYYRQGTIQEQLGDYQRLIDYWDKVTPPPSLESYHHNMLKALKVQKAFFVDWQEGKFSEDYYQLPQEPKIKESSYHLQTAYKILMQTFPQEDRHNQKAFFDYHCALDFL